MQIHRSFSLPVQAASQRGRERTPGPDDVDDEFPQRRQDPGPDDVHDPDFDSRRGDYYDGPDGRYEGDLL